MFGDMAGVIISIFFVAIVLVISELIRRLGKLKTEFTRKFVHIGVSHWWIVAMLLIKDIRYAIVPPVIFIILNYYSYKKDLIKSMERGKDSSDLGTVYFPISLIVLILLTWDGGFLGEDLKFLGALGALIMGYGDGFAAIIGENFGRKKYIIFDNQKSIEGSIAMFSFAFLVSTIILGSFFSFEVKIIRISFTIAVLAALTEAITPYGFDNLTVPIFSTLIAYYFIKGSPIFLFIYMACIGFVISFFIAYIAYRKESLTLDGSVGATLMGTLMYATSGIYGSVMMVVFFLSSSILSHFKKNKKKKVARQFDKTGRRDILQVFANGGVGLIHSILYYLTKNPAYLVFLGISFAAANADTWATELGILNKKDPISLRTFKRVEKGTSGAVSLFGTFSALIGSMMIGIFATLGFSFLNIGELGFEYMQAFQMVTLGGFVGSVIDSILGATVQGVYYSEELKGETEKKRYKNKQNILIRGLEFVNNDVVNFLSIGIASILFFGII
ncbi:MAG: DUF92 domain-containing protein [Thermoanaerobacteraceae bacterium]|nr:DUF92 domain-containing protein [Thermoanaerobacteraceae bacterium]